MSHRNHNSRQLQAHSWLTTLTTVLMSLVIIASLAIWRLHAAKILSVQSNSMAPALVKGDAVVLKQKRPTDLKVGDIVSYHSPRNPNVIITHRIVYIDRSQNVLVTKGDNVTITDGPVADSLVIGQVSYTIDRLGYILSFLRSPSGLIITIYLPAAGVLSLELGRLSKYYIRPTYRLNSFTH